MLSFMERDAVRQRVDEAIKDVVGNVYEGAREWIAERNLVHLSDTDLPSNTRCGKSIVGLKVHTSGPTDGWNMCAQCTARI